MKTMGAVAAGFLYLFLLLSCSRSGGSPSGSGADQLTVSPKQNSRVFIKAFATGGWPVVNANAGAWRASEPGAARSTAVMAVSDYLSHGRLTQPIDGLADLLKQPALQAWQQTTLTEYPNSAVLVFLAGAIAEANSNFSQAAAYYDQASRWDSAQILYRYSRETAKLKGLGQQAHSIVEVEAHGSGHTKLIGATYKQVYDAPLQASGTVRCTFGDLEFKAKADGTTFLDTDQSDYGFNVVDGTLVFSAAEYRVVQTDKRVNLKVGDFRVEQSNIAGDYYFLTINPTGGKHFVLPEAWSR